MENSSAIFLAELFERRKKDHIRFALEDRFQAVGLSGLDSVRLEHDALPELDLSDVHLQVQSLGQSRRTPFYIAGMTAGHSDALEINKRLASGAAARGWAFGLGSQRRDLYQETEVGVEGARLKDAFPELEIFSNLGIAQVIETPLKVIQELVMRTGSNALCIHLNVLQEMIQPEGTPRFKGGLEKIRACIEALTVPVILKETGSGFSKTTLEKLKGLALGAIDVSGLGGTHWGRIEGARAEETGHFVQSQTASAFQNWGISTAESTRQAALTLSVEVWSSGGVRNGLDAAKLIALGAKRVGFAKPALEAAIQGKLEVWAEAREYELLTALLCTGSKSLKELGEGKKWTIG